MVAVIVIASVGFIAPILVAVSLVEVVSVIRVRLGRGITIAGATVILIAVF